MKKISQILSIFYITIFVLGIVIGLGGRVYCTRSNDNYQQIQPESFVPDTIETVLYEENLKQIYVCYNDANCVNVYNESGEFLWCVSTPYLRYSFIEIKDNKLIIYYEDAYVYNAKNGNFLSVEKADKLNLDYDSEIETANTYINGDYYFDSFQVYKALNNGKFKTIVSRPWWYIFFSFEFCLSLSFFGALGIGAIIFIEKIQDYLKAKRLTVLKNKTCKIICKYYKITAIIQLIYALLNITLSFYTDKLIIIFLPLTIHFIISNIVLWNIQDNLSCQENEMQIVSFWKAVEIVTLIVALISVIITTVIIG